MTEQNHGSFSTLKIDENTTRDTIRKLVTTRCRYLQNNGLLGEGDPLERGFERTNIVRQQARLEAFANIEDFLDYVHRNVVRRHKELDYESAFEAGPWC